MARDRVTPEVAQLVLARDGRCVLSIIDASHACYDVWGKPHASDDLDRLTIEHVKVNLMMGRKAASDPSSLVALCGYRNVIRPMTKVERMRTREYLVERSSENSAERG